MGDKTGIEWTDTTWNPVRGCSRVSEGCRHCYAERVAARFVKPGQPYHGFAKVTAPRDLLDRVGGRRNGWTGVVRLVPEKLAEPLRWKKPRRIFVNSMSDLFHESLSNEDIAAVFGVMAAAPRHTFQVLTKRARRMREWFTWVDQQARSAAVVEFGSPWWPVLVCARKAAGLVDRDFGVDGAGSTWPLANVWLGVSVENQAAADERIPDLLATPAALRFLSCEPLLGPVNVCAVPDTKTRPADFHARNTPLGDIDWVIAGCESGPGARPAQVDWYRSLRDQCAAAGVPFFLKQAKGTLHAGEYTLTDIRPIPMVNGRNGDAVPVIARGIGEREKPGGVIALPYLDGVQHAAFPEAR